jgi:phage host-nuclease inhibitor protein Gam
VVKKIIKKSAVAMPQSREELVEYLKELNQAVRKKEFILTKNQKKIEEIERKKAEEVGSYDEEIEEKAEGIYLYCQLKRAELTNNYKIKTVPLPGGTVLWRLNPPSVKVKNEGLAILELETKNLLDFIRTKKEVDKEAVLKNPDKAAELKNVKVEKGDEVFVIKPAEVKIELEKGKKKFKRKEVK